MPVRCGWIGKVTGNKHTHVHTYTQRCVWILWDSNELADKCTQTSPFKTTSVLIDPRSQSGLSPLTSPVAIITVYTAVAAMFHRIVFHGGSGDGVRVRGFIADSTFEHSNIKIKLDVVLVFIFSPLFSKDKYKIFFIFFLPLFLGPVQSFICRSVMAMKKPGKTTARVIEPESTWAKVFGGPVLPSVLLPVKGYVGPHQLSFKRTVP